jgi:hypothetical protein
MTTIFHVTINFFFYTANVLAYFRTKVAGLHSISFESSLLYKTKFTSDEIGSTV